MKRTILIIALFLGGILQMSASVSVASGSQTVTIAADDSPEAVTADFATSDSLTVATSGSKTAEQLTVATSELKISDSLAVNKKRHRHLRRPPIILGTKMARDTTVFSRRSLTTNLIIPKSDWQIGMSVAYMNLSSDDSDFILMLNNATAGASIFRLSAHASYSYKNNRTVGLRFQYTNGSCAVDASTIDLLGNFSLDVKDVRGKVLSYASYVYNRYYMGLDDRGRVGLFIDIALGYTRSRSVFTMSGPSDSYTITHKIGANLSPGIVYFPMNNISVFAYLSFADISYNNSKGYTGGTLTGERNYFKAQAKVNALALNFGLTVHL